MTDRSFSLDGASLPSVALVYEFPALKCEGVTKQERFDVFLLNIYVNRWDILCKIGSSEQG